MAWTAVECPQHSTRRPVLAETALKTGETSIPCMSFLWDASTSSADLPETSSWLELVRVARTSRREAAWLAMVLLI